MKVTIVKHIELTQIYACFSVKNIDKELTQTNYAQYQYFSEKSLQLYH